jgi:hypothetical protein
VAEISNRYRASEGVGDHSMMTSRCAEELIAKAFCRREAGTPVEEICPGGPGEQERIQTAESTHRA